MKTAIVKVTLTQTGYLELDVDPEYDSIEPEKLMKRAIAAIYDGTKPEVVDVGAKAEAAWMKGAACDPEKQPHTSYRRCRTHGDLMSPEKDECWVLDNLHYLGLFDD